MSAERAETFYVVWNPSAGPPTYRHDTAGAAEREAERLAKIHPGQQFIVLGAVVTFEVPPALRVVRHHMEIPF